MKGSGWGSRLVGGAALVGIGAASAVSCGSDDSGREATATAPIETVTTTDEATTTQQETTTTEEATTTPQQSTTVVEKEIEIGEFEGSSVDDYDETVLLSVGEVESLGIGTGWEGEIMIDGMVAEGLACGLSALADVEHWYGLFDDEYSRWFEQLLIPNHGAEGVELFRALPDCNLLSTMYGYSVSAFPVPAPPGASETVGIVLTNGYRSSYWLGADVGGTLVSMSYAGKSGVEEELVTALGLLAERV